jgi:ATP-dependent DNA helicase RecQ
MLQIRVFTLRFSEATDGFLDQDALNAFMSDKEIVDIREEFFIKNNIPYWSVMIRYSGASEQSEQEHVLSKKEARKDEYSAILTEESTPLFNLLREWRNERARKDNMPPYILFTNKQLAEIAAKCPDTLTKLSTVEGVGKAKIEKYGKDILRVAHAVKEEQKKSVQPEKAVKEPAKVEEKPSAEQKQAGLWDEIKQKDKTDES